MKYLKYAVISLSVITLLGCSDSPDFDDKYDVLVRNYQTMESCLSFMNEEVNRTGKKIRLSSDTSEKVLGSLEGNTDMLYWCRKVESGTEGIYYEGVITRPKQKVDEVAGSESISNDEVARSENTSNDEVEIPMPKSGYQGKYFLVSNDKNKNKHIVVYRSVWPEETVFTKVEINCKNKKYRSLGEGYNTLSDLTLYPEKGKWVNVTEGGSSEDIVSYICS